MITSHRLTLLNMTCASCVRRAERVIGKINGVTDVSVNLSTETATFSSSASALPEIAKHLSSAGYPAHKATTRLQIDGITCATCVSRVERILKAQTGVLNASVNFATQIASVTFLDGSILPETLAQAVTTAGYENKVSQANDVQNDRKEQEEQALYRATLIAGVLTFPVFILEMGSHFIPGMQMWVDRTIGIQNSWIFQFVMISIVMAGPGWRFHKQGLPALLRGAPDMNSLVALGTLSAWTFSTCALFAPSIFPKGTADVYFEAAGVIITLILLGRLLEARAKGRTGAAIQRLVDLQPTTAFVERDGEFTELPLSDILNGDVLRLRPGARVATDGTVVGGHTFIDESMISGEPVPVSKDIDDTVIGGTINGTGTLTYRASAVGADTVLSQIIHMVKDAQSAKLPIQSMVDRITGVFVPIVMIISVMTVLTWLIVGPDPALGLALVAGVSVVIIACPCAMGLATPTSIMVATGRAAEMGVLFRKGDALQTLQESKVIAFDKTGTLTAGAPKLTTFETAEGWTRKTALPLIAALEAQSEHPIASAIVRATEGFDLPKVIGFKSITGMGVSGIADGKTVLVGADRFMTQEGIDLGEYAQKADALAKTGATPLFAAIDGQIAAVIGVSDPIKPTTAATISALHSMGLKVAMITGDNAVTANAIADQLDIKYVVAQVMPAGKVTALQSLRERHGKVAFVGDGINDAPALAAADTGIAIGTGTDVAIEAADVVLMSGDLVGAVNALKISQASMRNIRQNLFWAFAYNASLLPVATGVLYPITGTLLSPMLAAGAMALSSVFVVSNALRLRHVTPTLNYSNILSHSSQLAPIRATS
jgi:Cu+-exporting ATPase